MAGITEIRGRMRSIQQTLKITNAMYLISSAKVKKARKQLQEVEPYFDRLAKTILDIFRHSPQLQHRYIEGHHKPKEERKTGFVVITGGQGPGRRLQPQRAEAGGDLPGPQAGFHAVPHRPDGPPLL